MHTHLHATCIFLRKCHESERQARVKAAVTVLLQDGGNATKWQKLAVASNVRDNREDELARMRHNLRETQLPALRTEEEPTPRSAQDWYRRRLSPDPHGGMHGGGHRHNSLELAVAEIFRDGAATPPPPVLLDVSKIILE